MSISESEYTGHDSDNQSHDLARAGVGVVAMHVVSEESQIFTAEKPVAHLQEIDEELRTTYVDKQPGVTHYGLCGDDRHLTAESAAALRQEGIADPDHALRGFGGAEGFAQIIASSAKKQYGSEVIEEYGDNNAFTKEMAARAEKLGVVMCNHNRCAHATIDGVEEDDMQAMGAPIADMEGEHAPAEATKLVLHFGIDQVSNPRTANEKGLPAYNVDVTQIAELAIKSVPELRLRPSVILETILDDAENTRRLLEQSQNKPEGTIQTVVYGSPEAARAYLESITI